LLSFDPKLLASILASLLRMPSKVRSCLLAAFDEGIDEDPGVSEGSDGEIDDDPGEHRQQ
jgi:hypothetical protein